MLALYRSGSQADALAAYQDARRRSSRSSGSSRVESYRSWNERSSRHELRSRRPGATGARAGTSRAWPAPRRLPQCVAALAVALPFALRSGAAGLSTVRPTPSASSTPGSNELVDAVSVGIGPVAVAVGALAGVGSERRGPETVSPDQPKDAAACANVISLDDYSSDLADQRAIGLGGLGARYAEPDRAQPPPFEADLRARGGARRLGRPSPAWRSAAGRCLVQLRGGRARPFRSTHRQWRPCR